MQGAPGVVEGDVGDRSPTREAQRGAITEEVVGEDFKGGNVCARLRVGHSS